jgi:CheY-like chemotaxis protein/two-component sensor histidine kinase
VPQVFDPFQAASSTDLNDTQSREARLQAREDFFKLMSHEIRTPLNGVLGMLSLLTRTSLSPEQTSYLQTAKESGDHLLTLVNDLLDYARMEAGHIDLEITPVRLEPLLQGVAELLSPRAFQNGIDIAWSLDPSLSLIQADEGRLRQILFNLAGNAVKFTKSGGVLIEVGLTQQGLIRFSVRDTGPGIPVEARSRIFDAFSQVERNHATLYGGAGLGLMVVKKLVEAMKGTITLESEVGKGSTFIVEFQAPYCLTNAPHLKLETAIQFLSHNDVLIASARNQLAAFGMQLGTAHSLEACAPHNITLADRRALDGPCPPPGKQALILLAPEERAEIADWKAQGWAGYLIKPLRRASLKERIEALTRSTQTQTPHPPEVANDDERIHPDSGLDAHVLLVEDNPVNALLAQILLQREGCRVERAASGEEALDIMAKRGFDIVFMDLGLPGLDGIGTTRALRKRDVKTPIIALTANAYEEDRRACLGAGMNDFLTKPIEVAALRAKLGLWTAPVVRRSV